MRLNAAVHARFPGRWSRSPWKVLMRLSPCVWPLVRSSLLVVLRFRRSRLVRSALEQQGRLRVCSPRDRSLRSSARSWAVGQWVHRLRGRPPSTQALHRSGPRLRQRPNRSHGACGAVPRRARVACRANAPRRRGTSGPRACVGRGRQRRPGCSSERCVEGALSGHGSDGLLQDAARMVHMPFRGAFADAEQLGDLGVGIAVNGEQVEHVARHRR